LNRQKITFVFIDVYKFSLGMSPDNSQLQKPSVTIDVCQQLSHHCMKFCFCLFVVVFFLILLFKLFFV